MVIWAVSLLTTKLIPRSLTGGLCMQYSEFATIWYRITSPHRNSALPLHYNTHRRTSIRFGENQLAPLSIGISPLTTNHPLIFQHQSVRTSNQYYLSFILSMVRSSGFGSTTSDQRSIQARFHSGSEISFLTIPLTVSRRNMLQQARTKTLSRSCSVCRLTISRSFHSLPRVLFTIPSRYYSLSVNQEYLAL